MTSEQRGRLTSMIEQAYEGGIRTEIGPDDPEDLVEEYIERRMAIFIKRLASFTDAEILKEYETRFGPLESL